MNSLRIAKKRYKIKELIFIFKSDKLYSPALNIVNVKFCNKQVVFSANQQNHEFYTFRYLL